MEHLTIDVSFAVNPQATFYSIVDRDIDEKRYVDNWKNIKGFNWVIADGYQMPFQNEVFDKVTCLAVLPYVWNARLVLKEIHRILKPHRKLQVSHHLLFFYIRELLLQLKHLRRKLVLGSAGKLSNVLFLVLPLSKFVLRILTFIFNDNRQPYLTRQLRQNLETFTTPKQFLHLLQQTGFSVVQLQLMRGIARTHSIPIIIQIKAKKKRTCARELDI